MQGDGKNDLKYGSIVQNWKLGNFFKQSAQTFCVGLCNQPLFETLYIWIFLKIVMWNGGINIWELSLSYRFPDILNLFFHNEKS